MIPNISNHGQVLYVCVSILIENEREITMERCICMLESGDASTWWGMSYNFR